MDRYAESMRVFQAARGRLQALGFSLDASWELGIARVAIKAGRRKVAAMSFLAGPDRASMLIHPPGDGDIRILGGSGYIPLDQADRVASALDEVEALFRALLVRGRKLPQREFPTDAALRRFLEASAAVRLPGEEGRGPEGRGPGTRAAVEQARRLSSDFDRKAALAVLEACVEAGSSLGPDGKETDPGMGWMSRHGLAATAWRLDRLALAWERGSALAFLLPNGKRPVRELAEEAAPAPAP